MKGLACTLYDIELEEKERNGQNKKVTGRHW